MSTHVTRHPRTVIGGLRPSKLWASVLPTALHQQTQHDPNTTCPRRAGRSPGWPTPAPIQARWGWRGVASRRPPQGLPRGHSQRARSSVPAPPSTPPIRLRIWPDTRRRGEQAEPTSHRPCQIRAGYSGDRRGTAGSHGDTDRHSLNEPPDLSSQVKSRFGWCGGSRIRTLEGISRRIYRSFIACSAPLITPARSCARRGPCTGCCATHVPQLGPRAALHTVLAQQEILQAMTAECPDELRPRLLTVFGHSLRSAGWISFNADDLSATRRYYEQARVIAHDAQ
jgi:hypothetical protein